jgi:hypothetical protein
MAFSLTRMNIRVNPQGLHPAGPAPAAHVHRTRFNPRADILDEVVAGLLWMTLDLPADASRRELEAFAHHLVARIKFGAGEAIVESEIAFVQSGQLGRPVNQDAVHDLAGRILCAVKAS